MTEVKRTVVATNRRLSILPKYCGYKHFMITESVIFDFMARFSRDYKGAFWEMWELDNGGFYMSPRENENLNVSIPENYFEASLSPDAAGIVACLYAFGELASKTVDERFVDLFHCLRQWARIHEEGSLILAAID